jgi:hypothetical protein
MKKRAVSILVALFVLAAGPALASDLWLHVHVSEGDPDDTMVKVNVPLNLVASILPKIDASPHIEDGKLKFIDEFENEGVDIRGIWQDLRGAADGEFVTVRSKRENVRVAKEKGYMLVDVDALADGGETVRVRVPLSVMDALFSGEQDEVDLIAAIEALGQYEGEDLVRVESERETVRIWVDRQQEAL